MKKRGRPRKCAGEKLTERIELNLTLDLSCFVENAAYDLGMSVQEYIRLIIMQYAEFDKHIEKIGVQND